MFQGRQSRHYRAAILGSRGASHEKCERTFQAKFVSARQYFQREGSTSRTPEIDTELWGPHDCFPRTAFAQSC